MAVNEERAFVFGILGNIISCLVCLSPLPTIYEIYKKQTAEGFQLVPYVVELFSAMLRIYYALMLKKHEAILLITINTFCCVIKTGYIAAYLFYTPKKARIFTVKLFLLFYVFWIAVICLLTLFLEKGPNRLRILGYICMTIFALSVFVARLCIVRNVIRTQSVEFMPFLLSFFLTLGAVMWFCYGLFLKDLNIAVPNILEFIFGILQMLIYVIYKKPKKVLQEEPKLQELSEHVVDVVKLSAMVGSELNAVVPQLNDTGNEVVEDQTVKEQIEEIQLIMNASTKV